MNAQHEDLSIQASNVAERLRVVERKAAYWLYLGNRAAEKGKHELAERHYANGQKWHDEMNKLLGNS